jgi:hypothetical protein
MRWKICSTHFGKKTFKLAYKDEEQDHVQPFVMKEDLTECICVTPVISKRKEDQRKRAKSLASDALSQKNKTKKCCMCGIIGHNKITCSSTATMRLDCN